MEAKRIKGKGYLEIELEVDVENKYGLRFHRFHLRQPSKYNSGNTGGKYYMSIYLQSCCHFGECDDENENHKRHLSAFSNDYDLEICYRKLIRDMHNIFECMKCKSESRIYYNDSDDSSDDEEEINSGEDIEEIKDNIKKIEEIKEEINSSKNVEEIENITERKDDKESKCDENSKDVSDDKNTIIIDENKINYNKDIISYDSLLKKSKIKIQNSLLKKSKIKRKCNEDDDKNNENNDELLCESCMMFEDCYLDQPLNIRKQKLFDCYVCFNTNVNTKYKANLTCSGAAKHNNLCINCFRANKNKCPLCKV